MITNYYIIICKHICVPASMFDVECFVVVAFKMCLCLWTPILSNRIIKTVWLTDVSSYYHQVGDVTTVRSELRFSLSVLTHWQKWNLLWRCLFYFFNFNHFSFTLRKGRHFNKTRLKSALYTDQIKIMIYFLSNKLFKLIIIYVWIIKKNNSRNLNL